MKNYIISFSCETTVNLDFGISVDDESELPKVIEELKETLQKEGGKDVGFVGIRPVDDSEVERLKNTVDTRVLN